MRTRGRDALKAAIAWSSPATFGVGITPYAAAQFVTFDLPSYAEQAIVGSNMFALAYDAKDVTDPHRTRLSHRQVLGRRLMAS